MTTTIPRDVGKSRPSSRHLNLGTYGDSTVKRTNKLWTGARIVVLFGVLIPASGCGTTIGLPLSSGGSLMGDKPSVSESCPAAGTAVDLRRAVQPNGAQRYFGCDIVVQGTFNDTRSMSTAATQFFDSSGYTGFTVQDSDGAVVSAFVPQSGDSAVFGAKPGDELTLRGFPDIILPKAGGAFVVFLAARVEKAAPR